MAKSGFVIGSIVGATAIILLFAFVFVPTQNMTSPELIISNGHDATSLGDENTFPVKRNLTLVELFKKTEQGVVKIETNVADVDERKQWVLVLFMIFSVILLQMRML